MEAAGGRLETEARVIPPWWHLGQSKDAYPPWWHPGQSKDVDATG